MEDRDIAFIDFLHNYKVILIKDFEDFYNLDKRIEEEGLGGLQPRKGLGVLQTYMYLIDIYSLPQNKRKYDGWDKKTLYAECRNGQIAYYPYDDPKNLYDWYGAKPLSVSDIA